MIMKGDVSMVKKLIAVAVYFLKASKEEKNIFFKELSVFLGC